MGTRLTSVALSVFALAVIGCDGGAQIPTGIAGSTGAAGSTGVAGTTGAAGLGGSAGIAGTGGGEQVARPAVSGARPARAAPPGSPTPARTPTRGSRTAARRARLLPRPDLGLRDRRRWKSRHLHWSAETLKPYEVTSTVRNGAWHLSGNADILTSYGLVFNHCVDARAYDGISFTVAGNGYCHPALSIVDTAHAPTGGSFLDGPGPPDARPPTQYYQIPVSRDAGPAMTIRFPFKQEAGLQIRIRDTDRSNSSDADDRSKLVGLQFDLHWPGLNGCVLDDLVIDDLMFYKDAADGGADAPADTGSGN